MTWDGIYKRSSDKGQESPEVILARVDENIKFLKSGAELVRIQLNTHEIKDDKEFKGVEEKFNAVNRTIWIGTGIVTCMVFVINLAFKH